MPKQIRDQLFRLIKSLTKAEKRQFRLFVGRLQANESARFVKLFSLFDRMDQYDEAQVLAKMGIPKNKKAQLHNLKRHLYRQILASLRTIYQDKSIDIQLRELLDFARILYDKGMYMEGLRFLERAKFIASTHEQDILHLEIIEFQKMIEARHITRNRQVADKMDQLLRDSAERSHITASVSELSNLTIQIQGYYIDHGHARNEEEIGALKRFWSALQPPPVGFRTRAFSEQIHWCQSRMWYHYILLDLEAAVSDAGEWVNLFAIYGRMKGEDPNLYMRGFYYLLMFNFLLDRKDDYQRVLGQFQSFRERYQKSFNGLSRLISCQYYNLSLLNSFFLSGDFADGLQQLPVIKKEVQKYSAAMDEHRQMLFEYKFAYLNFMAGHYNRALDEINAILVHRTGFLRDDIQINARLLQLICHYELENVNLFDNLIPVFQRLVSRSTEASQIHEEALRLLRQLNRTPIGEVDEVLIAFLPKVEALQTGRPERKSLKYFDLSQWINKRLNHQTTK